MSENAVRFSTFAHSKDSTPKLSETTWPGFAAGLRQHHFGYMDKSSCPMFSPAEFRPGSTSRVKENVTRIWFAVLDLDMITTEQFQSVCRKLEPLDAIMYTTWNHPEVFTTKGLYKLRVCIRLTRPVEPVEWLSFWLALTAYFDNLNDPHCKDACRCYFGPFAPPGAPQEHCWSVPFSGGGAIDPSVLVLQTHAAPPAGTESISRDRLRRIAMSWRKNKNHYRSELGEALLKVCDGVEFAEHGTRDNTAYQLCADLAKELPHADPSSIAEHFSQSLQVMIDTRLTVEAIREKFERAQIKAASEALAKQMSEVAEAKLWMRAAFKGIDSTRDYPYTEPELDAMCLKMECSRDELRKRWIIQRGTLFYVLGPNAIYSRPYSDRDVATAVCRDLAPAISAGVTLSTETKRGRIYKSVNQLVREYGMVACDYVLDMRAQEARYDEVQKQFIEAPCPLRELVPTYDKDVAMWLDILAGAAHDDLLNWLAWVTDLDKTCAALFMTGAPDTGKSLLAYGVSRLWTRNGPTKLSSALDTFNDALASCPLVFADEKLPTDYRGRGRTSEIREFIADRSRPFKKKYCPATEILGTTRLIVASNNDNIMAIQEHLSIHDIQAIGDRFFHFRVQEDAAGFLKLVDVKRFVDSDAIAKHALWLRTNYPRREEGRFLIKPKDLEFFSGLSTRTGIRSLVLQWLIGYLRAPHRLDTFGGYDVRIHKGGLYVRPDFVHDHWSTYVKEPAPPAGQVSSVVIELSEMRTTLLKPDGTKPHYRRIHLSHLYSWAGRTEFMTKEEIDQVLSVDTETRIAQRAAGAPR